MSDATRAVALQNAVAVLGAAATVASVLEAAAQFDSFLTSEAPPQNAMATGNVQPLTNAGASPQKPTKPAKPAPAPKPAAEPAGPTKEQVVAAIKKLSTSGQLEAAKKILADAGATNVSTLDVKKYAAVIAACESAEVDTDPTA